MSIRIDNNNGTTFDVNETVFNDHTRTEFDNHSIELSNSSTLYGTPYVLDPSSPPRSSFTTFDGLGTRFTSESITFDRGINKQQYLRFKDQNPLD